MKRRTRRHGKSAQAASICFGFQDRETKFWVAVLKAITTTLAEMGHTVLERTANEDVNKHLEQEKDCIAQGIDGIIKAVEAGICAPNAVIPDPGFALTTANIGEREMDIWG